MSRTSMIHIDKILAKSKYVSTDHKLYKARKDGKELFFKYEDMMAEEYILNHI